MPCSQFLKMIQNHQGEMDVFLFITSLSTITGFTLMRRILESIYGWGLVARSTNLEKRGGTLSPILWFPGWAEGDRNESITNGLWIYQSYLCNEISIKTQKGRCLWELPGWGTPESGWWWQGGWIEGGGGASGMKFIHDGKYLKSEVMAMGWMERVV